MILCTLITILCCLNSVLALPSESLKRLSMKPKAAINLKNASIKHGSAYCRSRDTQRIIGGNSAYPGQFPWQVLFRVRISSQVEQLCGGSIIGARWVLTAAHCPIIPGTEMIYGTVDPSGNSPDAHIAKVSSFIKHPAFSQSGNEDEHDIAIAELQNPIDFNANIAQISLPTENQEFSESSGIVTGWGAYNDGNDIIEKVNPTLYYATVPLITLEECEARWAKLPLDYTNGYHIAETQLCAGAYGRGTAKGDSGGPLAVMHQGNYVLIGITSFGINLGPLYYDQGAAPGIYSRVASYCDFIKQNTQGDVTCSSHSTSYIFSLICLFIFVSYKL